MTNMSNQINLTEMEADVIGEVMNISMGAAATAMSSILDRKVSITTPRVKVSSVEDYEYSHLEPVSGVLIKYVEGISGFSMLLLKVEDLKKILSHLLSIDPDELQEFDEIAISAICEIMNQMMGSAASALASFLGRKINISPPEILDIQDRMDVQERFGAAGDEIVSIGFDISIDDLVKSEFVSIMEPHLAREIIKMSFGEEEAAEQEQTIEAVDQMEKPESLPPETGALPPQDSPAPAPAPTATPAAASAPAPVAPAVPAPAATNPTTTSVAKQQVQATPYAYPLLESEETKDPSPAEGNLDLIMSVPVQITVELGKTRKKIRDIAEFAPGNIVELDRQAGDQVDIVANGRLIARGDVVVVDDNYSVRITEIMKARDSFADIK